MKFRIYYGDGTTFEGEPEDAPTENVQAIIWDDPEIGISSAGRIVLHQWDIYIYSADIGWHGTNKYADLLLHLKKGCGPQGVRAVLLGQWISRENWLQILHRARTDEPFKPKSADKPSIEDGIE